MAKKKNEAGYLSAKEIRAISKSNRKITGELEKKWKRKNVPEKEYLTEMKDPNNAVEFEDLHTYFFTDAGTVKSVDGVSFEVPIGKTVGIVGESGCGKSVTSLSLMQLLQRPQIAAEGFDRPADLSAFAQVMPAFAVPGPEPVFPDPFSAILTEHTVSSAPDRNLVPPCHAGTAAQGTCITFCWSFCFSAGACWF